MGPGPDSFAGRVAWVTGSSRGIGRVIAAHLASLGASVAVHGSTPTSSRAFDEADSLESVARSIAEAHRVPVLPVHGDVTDEGAVKRIAGEIRARFGRIDLLVNCAGGDIGAAGTSGPGFGRPQPNDAVFVSLADLRAVLDRNLMSCILVCQEVVPEMIARRSGRVVNIGSIAGLAGRGEGVAYSTAKAAVHEYTRCLAVQLRTHNVTANVVAPGSILTPRIQATGQVDASALAATDSLERIGQPIDIAQAVAYLLSDGASYITGQVLRVDGGKQCWPA